MPLALQNRAFFEGRKARKGAEKGGGRGVARKGGKKEKRTHENKSVYRHIEIITFLIQKHFKTVTVTVILGKLIQKNFKMVIGNQWK